MKSSGAILVLSGPSGAGKSSLIKKVAQEIGAHYFSISTTTRPMREGEVNGIDYHFADIEEFKKDIEDEQFLEYALVHGNYYGTSVKPVKEALKAGKLVVFDIDVQGNMSVKNRFGDIATSVFITTPSLKELEHRLRVRGTDSEEIIQNRISMAKREVQRISEYEFFIVNDDLDKAAKHLVTIAKAARLKIPTSEINKFIIDWED
ncbi:guanylate kinase [Sulfurimonas sp. HSL-1716]|uniref:guanylate kinase n=1 Tax=Hydrocurvibacter sulfurireducens TaxID=3131937 RepID=UPI0031F7BADA